VAPRVLVELRRLGDFVQPPFIALYRPDGLQWVPDDRYAGRVLQRGQLSWYVVDPTPVAPAFDPAGLGWLPRGLHRGSRELPRILRGAWVIDPTVLAPFNPALFPHQDLALQILHRLAQPTRQSSLVGDPRPPLGFVQIDLVRLIDAIGGSPQIINASGRAPEIMNAAATVARLLLPNATASEIRDATAFIAYLIDPEGMA
jgi:hypothetical protein